MGLDWKIFSKNKIHASGCGRFLGPVFIDNNYGPYNLYGLTVQQASKLISDINKEYLELGWTPIQINLNNYEEEELFLFWDN
jgi:hypothetical protein